MDGEPLNPTAEQDYNTPRVESFSQERMLERMVEQRVNSLGHHRAEELVEERLFDEHNFSIQGQSLNRMVEQFSTSAQSLFEVPKLSSQDQISSRTVEHLSTPLSR